MTPLLYAVQAGRVDAVALLLERSADVNAAATLSARAWSVEGTATWSAIHCAAHRGDTEALALLLERGCSVDARATRGVTALHLAAYRGRLAATQQLVAHGADVHVTDDGFTALDDVRDQQAYARLAFTCACVQQTRAASKWRAQLDAIAALLATVAPMSATERREFAQRAGSVLWHRD